MEAAEVVAGADRTAADGDTGRVGRGLAPTGWKDFPYPVGAGVQAGEAIVAAAVGGSAGFASVQEAAVVGIQEDGPAGEAAFARVLYSVSVDVLEHLAADAPELKASEIVATTWGA